MIKLEDVNVENFKRYREVPEYVWHGIRYLAGGFYRAILGYDVIKDSETENRMLRHLDFFLNRLHDMGEYRLLTLKTRPRHPTPIKGIEWKGGSIPPSNFRKQDQSKVSIKPSSVVYYRYQRNHFMTDRHDLEFVDRKGNRRVFTIRSDNFNFEAYGMKEVRSDTIYDFQSNKE